MSYKMTRKCKKKSDIDDADEVKEITAARTSMIKNKHVCVSCNKTLALKNGCKRSSISCISALSLHTYMEIRRKNQVKKKSTI